MPLGFRCALLALAGLAPNLRSCRETRDARFALRRFALRYRHANCTGPRHSSLFGHSQHGPSEVSRKLFAGKRPGTPMRHAAAKTTKRERERVKRCATQMPPSSIDDNYCDCTDGSDEPGSRDDNKVCWSTDGPFHLRGTGACSGQEVCKQETSEKLSHQHDLLDLFLAGLDFGSHIALLTVRSRSETHWT